jgi:hypothetical protein
VAQGNPIRVELELDSDGDPIAGCLRHEEGGQVGFSGWMVLISALKKLMPPTRTARFSDARSNQSGEQ